jgi:hypothetical protein
MNPNEIPANRAGNVIKNLAAARRPSLSVCNCGWYGFKSTICPHHGIETPVKCGLTISDKTDRPIFCPKKAPTFTFPEHVVAKPCKDCRLFSNSVSERNQPLVRLTAAEKSPTWMLSRHSQPANASQAGPSSTTQDSTTTPPSKKASGNPN